jgi:hypothetical protein
MTRSRAAWAIAALVAAWLFLGSGIVVAPGTQPLVCDANAPGWMLAAQPDNARSGCIEILPSHMAPIDADWSIYCTMWCLRTWPEDAPDR